MIGVDISLERARSEDASQLLELIRLVQPRVPWTLEHFTWQFVRCPLGPARLYVARVDDRIVSLYAAIPQHVRTKAGLVRAFMVQDVMTHPAYRGRGLLHGLGQACLADIASAGDAGYSFPNHLSEGSFRRLGWTELGRVPLRSRAIESDGRSRWSQRRAVVRQPPDFAARASAIWIDTDADASIGVHRDRAFLAWRYSKPNAVYDCAIVGDDDAFLITKRYVDLCGTTLHICDLVARRRAAASVRESLALAMDLASEANACRMTAWLPPSHLYAVEFDGAGLGLVPDHERFMFVTGPVDGSWHLTQGDSDVY